MSNEPDAIRQEMDETRCSLTDKIGQLEQHVVDSVHEASAGVKQTVDAVKETVQSVRDTVGETVESVKESFSVSGQVARHPWMMMAGSAAAGLAAGYILMAPAPKAAPVLAQAPRRPGNGSHKGPSVIPASFADVGTQADEPKSVLDHLTRTFENEINQLKGLAIGTLAGVIRDLVGTKVPEMMRSPVDEVFNNLTLKLGGQPVRGRIVPDEWMAKDEPVNESQPQAPNPYRGQRQTTM